MLVFNNIEKKEVYEARIEMIRGLVLFGQMDVKVAESKIKKLTNKIKKLKVSGV